MAKQFIIKKVCNNENRPAYSYKLDEYFEDFVQENIIGRFNLDRNAKWDDLLSIMYFEREDNAPEGIEFYEPSLIEEENVKIYPVAINIDEIFANGKPPVENVVRLYFRVISLFFLTFYKSVSQNFLLELKDTLDWKYLLSLPYPTAFVEQQYVGD